MSAVTPDTFQPEHFDKLVRGLNVAKLAYERVLADGDRSEHRIREKVAELEEQLDRALSAYRGLVEYIDDVRRGIRTLDELFLFSVTREESK